MSLAGMLLSHINARGLYALLSVRYGLGGLSGMGAFGAWSDAAYYLELIAQAIFTEDEPVPGERADTLIEQINTYISDHICEWDMLSLNTIADRFYFNPAYLSRLYRRVAGEKLSDAITRRRVRAVNEMLRDPAYHINDIAQRFGFSSPANFSRFYKKETGLTPQEYRLRVSASGGGVLK